ncbi:MAG: hypothetical protein IJN64_08395 [Lachnospiraceae bacterium]|nr:hypothetical protein [Lachnospiraceae bacterium]
MYRLLSAALAGWDGTHYSSKTQSIRGNDVNETLHKNNQFLEKKLEANRKIRKMQLVVAKKEESSCLKGILYIVIIGT